MKRITTPIDVERIKKWLFLDYYLPAYTKIISNNFPRFYYIDGLAGSGGKQSSIGWNVGSPIRALGLQYPFTDYLFNEKNYCDELKQAVGAYTNGKKLTTRCKKGSELSDNIGVNISFFDLDVSEFLKKMLPGISDKHPSFIFLDPEGISEVPFDSVVKPCLEKNHSELLILFSIQGVNMCSGVDTNFPTLTNFYGTDKWKEYVGDTEKLINLYQTQLKKYKKFVVATPCVYNSKNSPVYCLIFASDNTTANKIFLDGIKRVPELWSETAQREFIDKNYASPLTQWIPKED